MSCHNYWNHIPLLKPSTLSIHGAKFTTCHYGFLAGWSPKHNYFLLLFFFLFFFQHHQQFLKNKIHTSRWYGLPLITTCITQSAFALYNKSLLVVDMSQQQMLHFHNCSRKITQADTASFGSSFRHLFILCNVTRQRHDKLGKRLDQLTWTFAQAVEEDSEITEKQILDEYQNVSIVNIWNMQLEARLGLDLLELLAWLCWMKCQASWCYVL